MRPAKSFGVMTKRLVAGLATRCKPYHLRVATEYGDTYGDQPWPDAEPHHMGQPMRGGLPGYGGGRRGYGGGPPAYEPQSAGWLPRTPARALIAGTALALGAIGLVVSMIGLVPQLLPRKFTAGQQRLITDWESGKRWRLVQAGVIFPASVTYPPSAALDGDSSLALGARRIGIARQATCRAAADVAAAAVLDRDGCSAMLRASYADGTDSYVVTVGVAVLPSTALATAAASELTSADGTGGIAGVDALPFESTPAAWFTDQRRQLSGAIPAGPYVVLYTVGYADSRPREPVSGDAYADAEMTSAGEGVAGAVQAEVGARVPTPHCPGTPGC